jgi:type II secretory ATPase GspE/PulE/Tfp pilus assembly ATPase PilB-like protein
VLPPRTFKKGSTNVTLGMIDGRLKCGRMTSFSPHATEQRVELSGAAGAIVTVLLPTEQVAYVAFHRQAGEASQREISARRRRRRVTGFHRLAGEAAQAAGEAPQLAAEAPQAAGEAPARGEAGAVTVRVHLAGATALTVEVLPEALGHVLGFYATPTEPDASYVEIFFYAHGVNAKEKVEPLGEMLLRRQLATPIELDRGLDEQVARRSIPVGQILVEQETVSAVAVEDAVSVQKHLRLRIGEVLVDSGLATPEQIDGALAEQKKRGGKKLGQILVELGILTETDLTATLAEKFHLPFVDLDDYPIDAGAARRVPREIIEKYGFLPLQIDRTTILVAISDPLAHDARDALRHLLPQRRIEEVLATPAQLRAMVKAFLDRNEPPESAFQERRERPEEELHKILDQLAADGQGPQGMAAEVEIRPDVSDSAVIRLVNQIIIDAYQRGASDIHVEPNGAEQPVIVRLRVDGECSIYQELPATVRASLVARMKIIASLDISERRKPQDGKIRFRFQGRMIELRVATIPTVNGNEDVVMRILTAGKPLPIDGLALSPQNLADLTRLAARPYGLVLVVGPTGSGKTTTLHSVLGSINTPDTKIWTAEDPVEITQAGLRQVQVMPRVGLTFAAAMRAFLRADPDVIMVGEMRDEETASTAVEASLTGHLVFSTLHTNSAPETVSRLIDMGVDPFTFADALLGILAQRLARLLCPQCREPHEATPEEYAALLRDLGPETLEARGLGPRFQSFRSRGCEACGGAGYKGRIGIHELMVVSDDLRRLIQRKGAIDDVRRLAAAGGMVTLLQDGLEKALAGKTDLRQVLAACSR